MSAHAASSYALLSGAKCAATASAAPPPVSASRRATMNSWSSSVMHASHSSCASAYHVHVRCVAILTTASRLASTSAAWVESGLSGSSWVLVARAVRSDIVRVSCLAVPRRCRRASAALPRRWCFGVRVTPRRRIRSLASVPCAYMCSMASVPYAYGWTGTCGSASALARRASHCRPQHRWKPPPCASANRHALLSQPGRAHVGASASGLRLCAIACCACVQPQ